MYRRDDDAKLADEPGRLAALERYRILDTPREEPFDRITKLVQLALNMPVAAVSLVDRDRQWFKSIQGVDLRETPRDLSFCNRTIQSRGALVVADSEADPRVLDLPAPVRATVRSYIGVPLVTADGYQIGALCAFDRAPRAFSDQDVAMLEHFAALVVKELELRQTAMQDELTGALNRRAFVQQMEQEVARFARYRRPSALILFDIDHFKRINDRNGHAAGDEVLAAIGRLCITALRASDFIGRLGGEEFGLLLPETTLDQAIMCAERMRVGIEALTFDMNPPGATASFGVAVLPPAREDVAAWMAAADRALYQAKEAGRNCIRCADPLS